MWPITAVELCVFVLIVVVTIKWWLGSVDPGPNRPPGPTPLPVIGNLAQLGALPCKTMTSLSKRYGNVFQLRFGARDVVVVSGYDTLRRTFARDEFTDRPDLKIGEVVAQGNSIVFNNVSAGWLFRKKTTVHAIHHILRHHDESLANRIRANIQLMCQRLATETTTHGSVNPFSYTTRIINRITMETCFGPQQDADALCKTVEDRFHSLNVYFPFLMIGDFMPWTRRLSSWFVGKGIDISQKLTDIFSDLTRDTLLSSESGDGSIVTSLNNKCDRHSPGELESKNLTKEDVLKTVGDIVGASLDTTGGFLLWVIFYLAKFPAVQEELYQSVRDSDGDMLRAFNWEVARHSCLSGNTLMHAAAENITLEGYFVPKGTIVIGNMHSVFSDERVFTDPDEFRPRRFLDRDGRLDRDLVKYVPMFGFGKRRCLGEPLARRTMTILTENIVKTCKVTEDPNHLLTLGKGDFKLVLAPKPFRVAVHTRS